MKNLKLAIAALLTMVGFALPANADTWTYDFENFATAIGGSGPRKAIDATLNGLTWHMFGVRSNFDDTDYHDGQASMRIYGEVGSPTKPASEITNFTLTTPRSIGTVSFEICANNQWKDWQVAWILQVSTDGNTWTTVGDEFTAMGVPSVIERTVNRENAMIRIVRADYTTYDFTQATSYSYITNIDNFSITDANGNPVILEASTHELDFGTMNIGESATKDFTVTHTGLDGSAQPVYSIDGLGASLFTYEVTCGESQDVVTVTCTANKRGEIKATLNVTWGEYSTAVALKAEGEKSDPNQLFSGGTGTEADPYLITGPDDMLDLSYKVEYNKETFKGMYFRVNNDFSMNGVTFRPIGNNFGRTGEDAIRAFSGTFDGDGHTISDLYVNQDTNGFVALFGITNGATIKNLTIKKSSFYAYYGVAAFVGAAMFTTIENCHTTADVNVSSELYYAAGICAGALVDGPVVIKDCTNAATVRGGYGNSAGILSTNQLDGTEILRCGNTGNISDANSNVAGIVAITSSGIEIRDCYNAGFINAENSQGATNTFGSGILATIDPYYDGGKIRITNCYNAGEFNLTDPIMAPIFTYYYVDNVDVKIRNCYYSSDINTYPYPDGYENIYINNVDYSVMETAEFAKMLNGGSDNGVWMMREGSDYLYPVPENLSAVGIATVKGDNMDAQIGVADGKLSVSGTYDSMTIYDVNGRTVDTSSTMARGIYFVKVTKDGKSVVKKILK